MFLSLCSSTHALIIVRAYVEEAFKLVATRMQRDVLRAQEPDIYQGLLIPARFCLLFLEHPQMTLVAGDGSPNSCLGAWVVYQSNRSAQERCFGSWF